MPDIGLIELALIGLVGFFVLGPERLPEFFSQVANVVNQGRRWMSSLRVQLEQEKQQLVKPLKDIDINIQSTVDEVSKDITAVTKEK